MSTSLYLHAGMQKAGSKSIQLWCVESADQLRNAGFRYAETCRDGVWHRRLFEEPSERHLQALRTEAERCRLPVIVSYEEMYLWPNSAIQMIASLFDDVNVLIIERSFSHWLNSFLNQMIKAHQVTASEIDAMLADPRELTNRGLLGPHIGRWRSELGDGAVTVRPFSEAGAGDVRSAFFDWLGYPAAEGLPATKSSRNPNPAADSSSLAVLLEVKRLIGPRSSPKLLPLAMTEAHARLSAQWLDTRLSAGPLLISPDGCRRALQEVAASGRSKGSPLLLPDEVRQPSEAHKELARQIVSDARKRLIGRHEAPLPRSEDVPPSRRTQLDRY